MSSVFCELGSLAIRPLKRLLLRAASRLLLRERARRRSRSDSELDSSSGIGGGALLEVWRVADRVTGGK